MFFFFPQLEVGEKGKEATISLFDARKDDETGVTSMDIMRVTTVNDEGEVLETHFGIQGKSDHLAQAMGKERAPKLSVERKLKPSTETAAA